MVINPSESFFGIGDNVALDRSSATGYNTLLLRPGDLNSVCPHSQFHTRPFTQSGYIVKLLL